jgi:hypothetical protein
MAKGAPATRAAPPKTTAAAAPRAAAPPTTGSINPAAKTPAQKLAMAARPADPVGDICLLPDIARLTH